MSMTSASKPRESARLAPASGVEGLLANPCGHYLAGPISLSFVKDEKLAGVLVWGRPTAAQFQALTAAHERLHPKLPAALGLVDVRYVELPDPSAYEALISYLVARASWLSEVITKLALVRSQAGLVGAATAGFFDIYPRPFKVETFTDLRAALVWLEREDADALNDELEGLLAGTSGTPAMLRALRGQLEGRPGEVSLEEAARALGVGARSLQRRMKEWGTTLQGEQSQAQVRVATRMLEQSDAPLTQIAMDVGCASLSHFSALFRKVTGETPSDWRKKRRG
jgi:AraC-like DNA-binding protein